MDVDHVNAPKFIKVQDATNWDWDKWYGDPPEKKYESLGHKMNC